MKCPFCHHQVTKVTDSRDSTEANAVRRRRECLDCRRRFTTFETVELTIQVHKRDGRFEDFQLQKLVNGLEAACRHTAISHDQVVVLASKIAGDLIQRHQRSISTKELGDIVMLQLLTIDPIAYIRFACVYNRFKNIEQLMEAIETIQTKDDDKRPHSKTDQFQEKKACL